MIVLLFRLIWALLFIILCGIVDIVLIIFTFDYVFGFKVDTSDSMFTSVDTLGEHGVWKTRFHWAIWRIKLKMK